MRSPIALSVILVLACTTGYQATNRAAGLEPKDLAGARRLYIGESAHPGMPHVTMNERDAARAAARIAVDIPDVVLVSTPQDADFVISVLFNAEAVCSHCAVGPETQWQAIVERGGTAHRREYNGMGAFLELNGRVREGASATRGFVRQLKEILRPRKPRSTG